jgi:methionyl-tRNA synthetase
MDLARKGNQYMQKKEPWIVVKQLKDNPGKQALIDNTLHLCLQLTANLAILINPFLPGTAQKMLHMMKVVDKILDWENAGNIKLLSVGYSLRPPELLFRKIEDEEITKQIEKLYAVSAKLNDKEVQSKEEKTESNLNTLKPEIVYDDFDKLDLRIGTILSVEKVPKADKLLKLEVSLGFENRTIVSGIAQHFKPEDLLDKQVVIVANLAPRKLKGIESNGMILTAEEPGGRLILVNPEILTLPGSNVK